MHLRTIMFILFCVIAVAPMALFWLLPSGGIYSNELESAEKRQLVIARILADRLESYHDNLINVFRFTMAMDGRPSLREDIQRIEDRASIRNLCIYNRETGKLIRPITEAFGKCAPEFKSTSVTPTITLSEGTASSKRSDPAIMVSGIREIAPALNGFFIISEVEQGTYVATVSPDYIRSTAGIVKFGKSGHAEVVDAFGFVISHPQAGWEEERYDMNVLPVTAGVRAGKTGVIEYYAPHLDRNVISAYSAVEGPGWGVVVPQPTDELMEKVAAVKYSMLTVLIIGLALAAILAYFASKFLTGPIEQMVHAMHRIGVGELRAYEKIAQHRWQPNEFLAARDGIKAMSERLQENIDTISRHAYLDGVTGLPNRECFRVLAQEEIEKMNLAGRNCALLFLDLDGFKQVNDVYGHRSGDDLLKGFATRLHAHCGNVMKQHARGADNPLRILPARLGGDEFVVLLSNFKDTSLVSDFAAGLFQRVFGMFKIHNGVSLQVSGSVGGAVFPEMATDFDELLRLADIAMYDAKNSGKGRFCLYNSETDDHELAHRPEMQRA